MKTLKKITFVLASALSGLTIHAQQDPMYTHYMYNTLMVNPGYAGSRDALTVTALHRSQWVDFKGAPVVQSITLHAPLKNDHFGLGLSVLNDKIGTTNKTSVFGDFAYRMALTKKSKLALGISAGANIFQANLSSLQIGDQADPVFQNNINNHVTPNFGFGAYYSRERFYAGVSVPNLIQNNYSKIDLANGNTLTGSEQRHYFFIAGAVINLSENVAFKPTTFVKVTSAAPVQADVTASFIFMKKLLLGAMFRTGDAFGGLVGFNITEQLHIGYSFDWSYGLQTAKYNQGSHEVVLRYDFMSYDKKQIHSPRHF
ncbi:MAG: type IX secretion system membrane protein PorP/SprF [Bacteroidota bacterium]|nr:type IX secretion system membrane protein PorP/SprF [Bacteroidota bacterium]MDP3144036.1 type IX secretion system membrane protein PorP/SprF [Bacteroidota bacterium]